jgi:MFS family permease
MGLNKDLSLQANEFSNAATIFFAAYLIAEIPTGELCFTSGGENATDLRSSDIVYILTKVSAGKWLGINVMLWGIATACTAAATNYTTLLVARIFLGICEAPVVPTLTLVSSQWYTKSEQGPRFAFWYCGLGFGQIIGGLLSFAFQHVTSTTFQGWRMMFVVLGCVTVVLGMATFFLIPDSPSTARFLTESEKAKILQHVAHDTHGTTGTVSSRFNPKQLFDALADPQLLLLSLMTILVRRQIR